VPGACLPHHRVGRALPGLLALEFVGEGREAQHDLVRGAVERALAILEVEEHADAGGDDLLERVGRLDRFAAETRFLGHDQRLERRPRLQRVHEAQEPGPFRELGPADPVIDEDRRVVHGPAFPRRVLASVLDLPPDRPLILGDAVLVR
jgi:hypothetical protein